MIGVEIVYLLAGALFGVVSLLDLSDSTNPKRIKNAVFWGAYAVTLLLGSRLPDVVSGCLVIVLALVGGVGGLGRGATDTTSAADRARSAQRRGNRLFLPALAIPVLTLAGSFGLRAVRVGAKRLIDPGSASVVALGLAAVCALAIGLAMFRQPAMAAPREGRRLLNMIGWAAVLPQLLASLGALFALAGVGDRVSDLIRACIPLDRPFAAVSTYTIGMALFTVVMGNAFAAFPVMTAAVGLPLLVRRFGGDPAVMAALGMLSGFCGTLMTPMAANFNVVPAALLELPDKSGVIKVQIPTAVALLVANTFIMYFLLFR